MADVPRFDDERWDLRCAIAEGHSRGATITWTEPWPEAFVPLAKAYAYTVLNLVDPPMLAWHKVRRISVYSLCMEMAYVREFAAWLSARNVHSFAEARPDHVHRYIAELDSMSSAQAYERVRSIQRLATYRDHLPLACGLPATDLDVVKAATLAKHETNPSPDGNTTSVIADATMQPLLAWAIRFIDEFAPDIIAAVQSCAALTVSNPSAKIIPTPIRATLGDVPWTAPFGNQRQVRTAGALLLAAAYIVIAYLSGMRTGEVLSLRRGCHERNDELDLDTLTGTAWKGEQAGNEKAVAGRQRADLAAWVVVPEVGRAIAALEALHDGGVLFPSSLLTPAQRKIEHDNTSRGDYQVNSDIRKFIAWINLAYTTDTGPAIPADAHGHVTSSRFRRTLAWFIVRQPGGLIAAARQYGHVSTKITQGYAGSHLSGFRDLLALERLEALHEQLNDDRELLRAGEHVSGPSAGVYRDRVESSHKVFVGTVITNPRQAERLLNQQDLQVHHGRLVTCVLNPERALCRLATKADGRITPDLDNCRLSCSNIAYTDRDIEVWRGEAEVSAAALASGMLPQPVTDRESQRLTAIRKVLDDHQTPLP